jgi:hypothetical protein
MQRSDRWISGTRGVKLERVVGDAADPHPAVMVGDLDRSAVVRLDEGSKLQALIPGQRELPLKVPTTALRLDVGIRRAVSGADDLNFVG